MDKNEKHFMSMSVHLFGKLRSIPSFSMSINIILASSTEPDCWQTAFDYELVFDTWINLQKLKM